jgi:hypothetical protein
MFWELDQRGYWVSGDNALVCTAHHWGSDLEEDIGDQFFMLESRLLHGGLL